MAYITVADYKAWLAGLSQMQGVTYTPTDDAALTAWVAEAEGMLHDKTGRRFASASETRYYDKAAVSGSRLFLDTDLLSIGSVVNGDGVTLDAANYRAYPLNGSPKWAVDIVGKAWQTPSSGGLIAVTGDWGYMAAATDDVKRFLYSLTYWLQETRTATGKVTVFDDGSRIVDSGLPVHLKEWLTRHTWRSFR